MSVSNALDDAKPPGDAAVETSAHIPGEPGLWLLLFGDMMVFAVLLCAYLRDRGRGGHDLFAQSQDALNRDLGAANTIVLLCSSLLVVYAVNAARNEKTRCKAPKLMLAGFGVGSIFVLVKLYEYQEKLVAGITPATNPFYMYYFVLTGLHLLHVIAGLGLLLLLSRVACRAELSRSQLAFLEGGGCFWHMVDLLWLIIFPLVFLVR